MVQHSSPPPLRAVVLDLISRRARAEPDAELSDEDYFLAQLRAAVAMDERPGARLHALYGGVRPDRLRGLLAGHSD